LSGVGVVAALAAEGRALGPAMPWGGVAPLSELALLGEGSLLAVSGIGRAAAEVAANALVDAGVSALMTFGMAGGLDPALAAGTVFLPAELISAAGARFATCRSWRQRIGASISPPRAWREGRLLVSDHAIETLAEKAAAFRETGAAAVDMESLAVAAVAAGRKLPFVAVRVIVDTAADMLPGAVVAASRAGRVRIGRLIAGLALAPGEIGALVRLAARYRTAKRSLRAVAEAGALVPLDSDTYLS
jgi:adenosylhomocysteine nucleosidase